MSVIVLGLMGLYVVVALIAVRLVWKRTARKLYRWMAVAVAVLLPSWDAVLSTVFFYAACPFFSKAEIYETAETEGIYYEGDYRNKVFIRRSWDGNEVSRVPFASSDIKKGYRYMESLVTLRKSYEDKEMPVSPPVVYRCIEGPKDEKRPWEVFAQCAPAAEIRSRYAVKSQSLNFALIEMDFMKIYDRSTGRSMAEYREIAKHPYVGAPFYPFFTWLNWHDGTFKAIEYVHCPEKSQFFSFQYEVLRAKQ
ncbi:MAG: hypothetical protein KBH73_06065 [Syntrophobacterales bacterium]|nr:hypothetical protein [Syntrophobacterales bacterium]HNQ01139.1 hypothetical protein [Syntrophales bacterium]HNS53705.1 hypothetical protein [Syntrophales bacterium]